MPAAIDWYDANAKDLTTRYESLVSAEVHGWLLDLLPSGQAVVLDVGAGTGRDASWLTQQGFSVVAVEPSAGMRAEGQRLHPAAGIHWIEDALPEFRATGRLGLSFDLILLSAVWMHIAPGDRPRAFRKLTNVLKPGGLLAITLRIGPSEADRGMYEVSELELEQLAKAHGAFIERRVEATDAMGRSEVRWIQLAIRLPDDGTGALPLLRHIILNDDKSSTYKLALLRALCRIADGSAGMTITDDEHVVAIPLGLVALYWIRLFMPLLAAGAPQTPTNKGLDGLGFVKDGFRRLLQPQTAISHHDLRPGSIFTGDRALVLHQALTDAAKTITTMPAHYMTYPSGGQILEVRKVGRHQRPNTLCLDTPYLFSFGELRIPRHMWQALQRFDVWIEPALIAEWSRLMKGYATKQRGDLNYATLVATLKWSEPSRDVSMAREQALTLMARQPLRCVWTDVKLTPDTLDIDHCLPWAAWPCGDLWNLMPAHRRVNQHQKRDQLPAKEMLHRAEGRILEWWSKAYMSSDNPVLSGRFCIEARASLPLASSDSIEPADVYTGMQVQRLRLKHDQQIPEWLG